MRGREKGVRIKGVRTEGTVAIFGINKMVLQNISLDSKLRAFSTPATRTHARTHTHEEEEEVEEVEVEKKEEEDIKCFV